MNSPEVRTFEKSRIEIANFDNVAIGRGTFEPGWSWEKCVRPIVKTNSCEAPYTSLIISGRIKVVMDDGTEAEGGPDDIAVIPPGHNGVVGDEPCIMITLQVQKNTLRVSSN